MTLRDRSVSALRSLEDAPLEDSEETLSAYHESGHAVIAVFLGGRVLSVTISPDNDGELAPRFGDTRIAWPKRLSLRERCERSVLVALAGPVAERIYREEPFHPGMVAEWAEDWRVAWEAAATLASDERKRLRFLEATAVKLDEWLRREAMWAAVAALADELSAHETLDADQVSEVVATWLG
ncbi:MAG: ATP-dependent zinc metalloprotease FtsH [Planctomycetota bacterium]